MFDSLPDSPNRGCYAAYPRLCSPLSSTLAIMSQPYTYAEAKSVLVEILTQDTTLHDSGGYGELGANYDEVDQRLPHNGGPEFKKLLLAFEFWSGWLNSAEHDWSIFARTIVRDLNADRQTNDPVLLKLFAPKPRGPSLFSRVRSLFKGEN
ncbi:MAG TPA: hypothetical protein PLB54_05700 [Nitrosomonas sp.]|nr:hypothetical protein [Nitrosomonas sp.]